MSANVEGRSGRRSAHLRQHHGLWLRLGALLLLASCASRQAAPGRPPADLGGNWVLNASASETADLGDRGKGSGLAQRMSMGGRGTRAPLPGTSSSIGNAFAEMRDVVEALNRGSASINIAHTSEATTVTFADTTSLYLRNNGSKTRLYWWQVGEVEASGHWDGATFVVVRKLERGLEVRETFIRSTNSGQLVVVTVVEGSPLRELEFKRVYDRAQ
jgi:hypothetical protein